MMNVHASITIFLVLLLSSSIAYADVYRHTDEHGKVYYSDKPAEGSEKIKLKKTYIESNESIRNKQLKNTEKEIDQYERDIQDQKIKDDRSKARSDAEQARNISRKKRECNSAKSNLNNSKEKLKDRKQQGVRLKEENRLRLEISENQRTVDEKCD